MLTFKNELKLVYYVLGIFRTCLLLELCRLEVPDPLGNQCHYQFRQGFPETVCYKCCRFDPLNFPATICA